MFRGRYPHTIDPKGRVSMPTAFRAELQEHEDRPPFVTNLSRCLALFPQQRWLEFEERMASLSQVRPEVQAFQRFLVSGAQECAIDRQGRILLPQHLRQHAGLEREVIIAGVGPRIEIWDRSRLDEEIRRVAERNDEISTVLADLGL
jgi:MraZ protein